MIDITLLPDSWLTELLLLALAFVLSVAIGVERSRRLKSAGLRTHTLVGLGSAMFTLVSAYGFQSILGPDVTLDPSRIAAQIVSGIGFLGAGVIFVKNDAVNGLTTAASVWMTAAIGMACGAGMPVLAIAGTALHLASVTLLTMLNKRIRRSVISEPGVEIRYRYSKAVQTAVLEVVAESGYAVTRISRPGDSDEGVLQIRSPGHISSAKLDELLSELAALRGVRSASRVESDDDD
ncbi:MAG: MgtC/SapB family protein [Protaetiibacter sp.]